jgi:hypothetical protein
MLFSSVEVQTFRSPIEQVVQNKGGAGALLGFGLLGALWSASAYVAAFMRLLGRHLCWTDVGEKRRVSPSGVLTAISFESWVRASP